MRSGNHQGLGALGELLDDCSAMAGRLLPHRGSIAKWLSGWFAGGLVKWWIQCFQGRLAVEEGSGDGSGERKR
jgi:hypothetical protein